MVKQQIQRIDSMRLDKWLWAARFFKTRTLATGAIDEGRVRLRGERCKPAHGIKPGDQLRIDNGATVWEVKVLELSEHRGPATDAQRLYQETDASLQQRQDEAEARKYFREPGAALKGRPTKRDRRLIDGTWE
ncbi:MAG: RNA-binding S4 domain-containing protein [Janthinobacterium lividum]